MFNKASRNFCYMLNRISGLKRGDSKRPPYGNRSPKFKFNFLTTFNTINEKNPCGKKDWTWLLITLFTYDKGLTSQSSDGNIKTEYKIYTMLQRVIRRRYLSTTKYWLPNDST